MQLSRQQCLHCKRKWRSCRNQHTASAPVFQVCRCSPLDLLLHEFAGNLLVSWSKVANSKRPTIALCCLDEHACMLQYAACHVTRIYTANPCIPANVSAG